MDSKKHVRKQMNEELNLNRKDIWSKSEDRIGKKKGNIGNIPNSNINTSPYGFYASLPVTSSFRLWFLTNFGYGEEELKDSSLLELLRLAAYLLPGGYSGYSDDEHEMCIVMSHSFATAIARPGSKGKSLKVRELLAKFQEKFWLLDIVEADRLDGRALTIVGQSYPLALKTKLDEMANSPADCQWVDLIAGCPWIPPSRDNLQASKVPEVEKIRLKLNSLDPSHFNSILSQIDGVVRKVDGRKNWSVDQKRHQKALLRQIALNPKPYYKAVDGTTRLYAEGASFLGLSRDVRELLTGQFWKFDLSAAQLRIASALWGFELIVDPKDGSVWTYLLRQIGCRSHNKDVKNKLKGFIYPALFGQCKTRLKARANSIGMPGLMKDPMVVAILAKRDKVLERLKNGETMKDAWGNSYMVDSAKNKNTNSQARSIMAAICQSYELKLLLPIFDYAEQHGLTIVALLHDGIYCAGDWEPHILEIEQIIEQRSKDFLGVLVPITVQSKCIIVLK
jgi:hypothetical protein